MFEGSDMYNHPPLPPPVRRLLCLWGGAFLPVGSKRGVGDGDPRHPSSARCRGRVPALCLPLLLGAGGRHLSGGAGPVLGPGAGGGGGANSGWRCTGRSPPQHTCLPRLQALSHGPGSHLQPAAQTALPRVPQGGRCWSINWLLGNESIENGKYSLIYSSLHAGKTCFLLGGPLFSCLLINQKFSFCFSGNELWLLS